MVKDWNDYKIVGQQIGIKESQHEHTLSYCFIISSASVCLVIRASSILFMPRI